MAFLSKSAIFRRKTLLRTKYISSVFLRSVTGKGTPFRDEVPPYCEIVAGPLPTTEKERAAAAAKYGLKPEDYVTYDNGMWGDYPKTPDRPMTDRDYFYDWDYPELQRDYGDIVPIDLDQKYPWLWYKPWEGENPPASMTKQLSYFMGLCFLLWFTMFGYDWVMAPFIYPKVAKKQFPYMGEVHYTFDKPGEEKHH